MRNEACVRFLLSQGACRAGKHALLAREAGAVFQRQTLWLSTPLHTHVVLFDAVVQWGYETLSCSAGFASRPGRQRGKAKRQDPSTTPLSDTRLIL